MRKCKVGVVMVFLAALVVSVGLFSAPVAAQVELVYANHWWLEPGRDTLLQSLSDKFEAEHPNIKIKPEPIPWPDYCSKLSTELGGGGGPDIMWIFDTELKRWQKYGFLEPLDEYIDFSGYDLEKLNEIAIIEERRYAVLNYLMPLNALLYNRLMLADAGVAVPTNPEDFIGMAKKLTKPPEQFALAWCTDPGSGYFSSAIMGVINAYGGRIARKGVPSVNQWDFIQGVKMVKRMFDAKITPVGMDYRTQRKLWWNGKVAMVCNDGPYLFDWIIANNPEIYPAMATARVPFPTRYNQAEVNFIGISSISKHKKEAAEYIKFWLRRDIQKILAEAASDIRAVKGVRSSAWSEAHPYIKVYEADSYYAVPMAVEGLEEYSEQIRTVVADHVAEVMFQNKPAEQAMAECQKALEELVESKKK